MNEIKKEIMLVGNSFRDITSQVIQGLIVVILIVTSNIIITRIIGKGAALHTEIKQVAGGYHKNGSNAKIRIYGVGISYHGRTYDEGKKIGWKDGVRAFYCMFKYGILKMK